MREFIYDSLSLPLNKLDLDISHVILSFAAQQQDKNTSNIHKLYGLYCYT